MKMIPKGFCEMLVLTYRTTRRHKPEDHILDLHRQKTSDTSFI